MSYKVDHEASWQHTFKEARIIGSNKKTFEFSYRMTDKSLSAPMLCSILESWMGKLNFHAKR